MQQASKSSPVSTRVNAHMAARNPRIAWREKTFGASLFDPLCAKERKIASRPRQRRPRSGLPAGSARPRRHQGATHPRRPPASCRGPTSTPPLGPAISFLRSKLSLSVAWRRAASAHVSASHSLTKPSQPLSQPCGLQLLCTQQYDAAWDTSFSSTTTTRQQTAQPAKYHTVRKQQIQLPMNRVGHILVGRPIQRHPTQDDCRSRH